MKKKPAVERAGEIPILLFLLSVLLFVFQYVSLEKFNILPPGVNYRTIPRFIEVIGLKKIDLDFTDGLLLALIFALGLCIVILELWRKRLSLFLDQVFASEKQTLWLLAISSLVLVRFYFARGGINWGADAPQHICYAYITAESIARGEIPTWTNYMGSGTPYLQFYGFLFFYLVGLVDLLSPDFFLSLKLVLGGSHILSGIGVYLFVRFLTHSRKAGFLAGLAYVLSFWHTQQILIMGRFPLSLFYALLPWPFYFFERLRFPHRRASAAAAGALTSGLLTFTHPGYAFWATALLGLFGVLRLIPLRRRAAFGTICRYSLILLAGGVLFGAFLTLGMWLERGGTGLNLGFHLTGVPGPTWHHVLVWSNFRFWLLPMPSEGFHWYGGYLGLSLVLITLAGSIVCFLPGTKFRRNPLLAAGTGLLITTLLAFAHHLPPLRDLMVVQAMPAGRYLLFVVFFLAVAVGIGYRVLTFRFPNGFNGRLPTLLLIFIMADLGPTTFQHPFIPTDASRATSFQEFKDQAQLFLEKGELPNYRLFWARGEVHPYFAYGRLLFSGQTPLPHGFHPGDLLTVFDFVNPLERFLSTRLSDLSNDADLSSMADWKLISSGLKMLNAKYIIATQGDKKTLKIIEFAPNSPILVAPHIAPFPEDHLNTFLETGGFEDFLIQQNITLKGEELERIEKVFPISWIIDKMEVENNNTCKQILLRGDTPERDMGTSPRVDLLSHQVWNQRVEMRVRISAPCFARLAYSFSPHLRVRVDDQVVHPFETAGRFIALPLDPGEHLIVLEPHLSPLRRGLLLLDLLLIGLSAWIWIRERNTSL